MAEAAKYASAFARRGTVAERRAALQGEILALLTPEQLSALPRHAAG